VGAEKEKTPLRQTVIGILAHVDAGKTTLSEALLYESGAIRNLGRVDHGDAHLDTFALERQRGITIFAKQARLRLPGWQATLLDTPGHVDFSPEAERTLDVLDCAVLVVSASAGVQSHTRTLWKLLRQRNIPTFLFVNKTDLPYGGKEALLTALREQLGEGVFDLEDPDWEGMSLTDEALLEEYLADRGLKEKSLRAAVRACKLFPCRFGAALHLNGAAEFLEDLRRLAPDAPAGKQFGAKVFKIAREEGVRLSYMKVTGGVLRVRDSLSGPGWTEKVSQLRFYSGGKFEQGEAAYPGDVVAVAGLTQTGPGQGLGAEGTGEAPRLAPVITCQVLLPASYDPHRALTQLRQLEEEEPQLRVSWEERTGQLCVQVMGPVQLEVLHALMLERFGLDAAFGPPKVLYRETIADTVEGVGHYEPLRHYAEVHLLLSPGERGSGVTVKTGLSEDVLDRNWQRLILGHVLEKQHLGVLTGAPITDIEITLAAGRAHLKHTEGGDFRQATYRAIRQGLMQAKSVLLEPWYQYRIELPQENVGRVLSDLTRLGAETEAPAADGRIAVLAGKAPVAALRDYPETLAAVTHGMGSISLTPSGYAPCRDQARIVAEVGYDPAADLDNPPHSVFCEHGAGVVVPWDRVFERMHLPSVLRPPREEPSLREQAARYVAQVALDDQLAAIFERTYGPIRREKVRAMAARSTPRAEKPWKLTAADEGPEYLLVDGYNIIHAWDSLRKLAEENLDAARHRLIERLRNFQGFRQSPVIVVFDAYKVKGNPGSIEHLGGLDVVYTKEAETADMYIEKATYDLRKHHRVRVATSDGLEQVIILGHGALRVPALAFEAEVKAAEETIRAYLKELQ
jgi:small GTP-binding protein